MTDITKQFRLYAPQSTKSYTTSDDGGLIIEGIASTTNKDLTGDVVLPSAIQSMKQQLTTTTKNLHGDHKYGLDGILGVIREVVETDDDQLVIRAAIRKTYAPAIKEMLDLGVNLGLSIGGNVKEYNPIRDGWEIKDIELFEISLTGMPANWDTYGTITTTSKNKEDGGVVESKCLAGACHLIRKQLEVQKMPEENNQQPQDTDALTVEEATNLFNELMADKQEEIKSQVMESIKSDMKKLVDEAIAAAMDEPSNKEGNNDINPEGGFDAKSLEEIIQKTIMEATESLEKKQEETFMKYIKNSQPTPTPKPTKKNGEGEKPKKYTNKDLYEMFKANKEPSLFDRLGIDQ